MVLSIDTSINLFFDKERKRDEQDTFYIENPHKVIDGIYTCGDCKCKKIHMYQKQSRSQDEPMSLYCTCINCGKKWVM